LGLRQQCDLRLEWLQGSVYGVLICTENISMDAFLQEHADSAE